MDFTSYQQVIDAFKAGAKFEVRNDGRRVKVTEILADGRRMEVRTEATTRGLRGWVMFEPDGGNLSSTARLVMTQPPPEPKVRAAPKAEPRVEGYFVALVENGVPKFSKSPVKHPTATEAGNEARRLAAKHQGKTFQIFMHNPLCSPYFTEPAPPKPKTRKYRTEAAANQDGKVVTRTFEVKPESKLRGVGARLTNMEVPELGILGGTIVRVDEFEVPVK